jgi:CHAD domain-containing protein
MTALETYYRERCADYEESLRETSRRISPEAIHRLRVVVKKLRALFDLISKTVPEFDFASTYTPFKQVFKAAAEIRDLDITISFVQAEADSEKTSTIEILEILKKKKRELAPHLKHAVSDALARDEIFSEHIAEMIGTRVAEEDSNNFLGGIRTEIERVSTDLPTSGNLHATRKLLKQYLYIGFFQTENASSETIHSVQHLLGLWHDTVIAETVIDDLIKTEAIKKKSAASIRKTIQSEERRRKAKARKAIETVWG